MEILGQSTKTTTPRPYIHLGYLSATNRVQSPAPLVPGILFLSYAIIQLVRKKKKSAIIYGLLSLAMFALALVMYLDNTPHKLYQFNRNVSERNLESLYVAISDYAQKNNGDLPVPAHWCDLLVSKMGIEGDTFENLASFHIERASGFAFNENMAGMKLGQMPSDAVLLFETRLGARDQIDSIDLEKNPEICWNQVGGLDDITTFYEKSPGACVLFADGHTAFVPADEIASLRWTVEAESDNGP